MDRTRADAALFHRLVRVGNEVRIVEVGAVGPAALVQAFAALEGLPADTLPVDVVHALPVDAFGVQSPAAAPASVREAWWAPNGVVDVLGANVCRSGRLLGVVRLLRLAGSAPFTADDVAAANGELRWARAELEAAEGVGGSASLAGAWVLSDDGGVLFAPADASDGDALRPLVRAFAAGGGPSTGFVAGHAVALERLEGPSGRAVLVRAIEAPPIVLDGVMHLTALKRRIAVFAAEGATVPEIADALGRSPETVRTHLKRIYEQLGVGSRLELAAACRNAVR